MVAVLVAGPLYAIRGRPAWFLGDEWVFLTHRGLDVENLFRPHNQHWTTLPVLVYRGLWNVVGLDSYRPYQAITIGLHLVIVLLLWAVLRRSGVRPWAATVGATALLFYGHGSENVLWAFQMSFLGSVAFGLAHLLLADHPAPSRRRVAGAIACGVGAVMCSGVGLVMIGIVGLTTLVRRGIRAAVVTTAPALAVYAVWWITYGQDEDTTVANGPRAIADFAFDGIRHALESAAGGTALGLLVIAVTVAGLAVAVTNRSTATGAGLRSRLAAPGSMALAAVAFYVVAGRSRGPSFGEGYATRGRFAYIGFALLVPIVVLAVDELVRRWHLVAVPALALFLLAVPANIRAIEPRLDPEVRPRLVFAMAGSEGLATATAGRHPFPEAWGASTIDVRWFRQAVDDGRVPINRQAAPAVRAEALARLSLEVVPFEEGLTCRPLVAPVRARVGPNRPLGFSGRVLVAVEVDGGRSEPVEVASFQRSAVSTTGPSMDLLVTPAPIAYPAEVCR